MLSFIQNLSHVSPPQNKVQTLWSELGSSPNLALCSATLPEVPAHIVPVALKISL